MTEKIYYNPYETYLIDGYDGRVECPHSNSGCEYYFSCCDMWSHCRYCHRVICKSLEDFDNLLDDLGLLKGVKVRCVSCFHIQDGFHLGKCDYCERYFGRSVCVNCEIATDLLDHQHCYKCNYCIDKRLSHCNSCNDCCCFSEGGRKFRCIEHNNECSICCDSIHKRARWYGRVIVNECGHQFHRDCFEDWMKRSRTCPLCRVLVDLSSIHVVEGMKMDDYLTIRYAQKSLDNYDIFYGYEAINYLLEVEVDYLVAPSAPPLELVHPWLIDGIYPNFYLVEPSAPSLDLLCERVDIDRGFFGRIYNLLGFGRR
jgi:hypothetical protein